MKRLILLALCALLSLNADARTLYVDAKRPNNNGNGLSKVKAKKTIQAAINVAKKGDTIVVYPGAYTPIKTKNKKVTIKAVNGRSKTFIQAATDDVILADLGQWGKAAKGYNRSAKTYYQFYSGRNSKLKGGTSSTLAGFTLRPKPFKYENETDWYYDHWSVGAVTGGTVKNCMLDNCGDAWLGYGFAYSRTSSGSKVYYAYSFPTIYKSKLTGCTISTCKGGEFHTITKNYSDVLTPESGLAICDSILTRCKIVGNKEGWAPDNQHNPFLVHDSKFYNCLIAENERMKADNCVFANCTIAKNPNFATAKSKVQSCIVYKCGKDLFKSAKKNTFTNTFKDDRDPKFVDYAGGEYHLTAKSPCIDKGKKVSGTGSVDLDGEKRARGAVDMGCYEYFASQSIPVRFYSDEATLLSTKVYNQTKSYGTLPVPKKANHLFAGWWTDPSAGSQVFSSTAVTKCHLYAHWIELRLENVNPSKTSGDIYVNSVEYYSKAAQDWKCQSIGVFKLVIPSKLGGVPVTGIGGIDPGIAARIKSVTIPSSIQRINAYAFSDCTTLSSLSIPNSVKSIDDCAFKNCSRLTSVTIPDGTVKLGNGAFRGCSLLSVLTIGSGLSDVGSDVFEGCPLLKKVIFSEGWTSLNNNYFGGLENFIEDVILPRSLRTLGTNAFFQWTALKSVVIPEGVEEIGTCAFSNCGSLSHVTIPNSVLIIGADAFGGCAFESIDIPNSVIRIENSAFDWCSSLKSICIPSSVEYIGDVAFCSCESLETVTLPSSVTSIGYSVFNYCPVLTTIRLQNGSPLVPGEDFAVPDGCTVVRY